MTQIQLLTFRNVHIQNLCFFRTRLLVS